MPSFNITTLDTTAETLTGFDTGLITRDGVLSVGSGPAVTASNSAAGIVKLTVLGSLITNGNGSAATRLVEFNGAEMTTLIAEGASASAIGTSALGFQADYDDRFSVTNHGTIDTDLETFDLTQTSSSAEFELFNTGIIRSSDTTIDFVNALGDNAITNTGTIIGGNVVVDFDSSTVASTFDLFNSGQMIGRTETINLASMLGAVIIRNSGLISGETAIANSSSISLGNTTVLINSGQILATNEAYEGSIGMDTIINTGEIVGDIDLSLGDDVYRGRNGTADGAIEGGFGKDLLIGGAQADILFGGEDDDELIGLGGMDGLVGGGGFDSLSGGDGGDLIDGGSDNDILKGGGGGDEMIGGTGDDTMYGGDGHDTMDGGNNRDDMFGGNGNDTMFGGDSADEMRGGQGDDRLEGGSGGDIMHAGAGDDMLIGGNNADEIRGGAGSDALFGGSGGDTLNGGRDDDTLTGGGSADIFVFNRNAGDDVITDFANGSDQIDLSAFGLRPADYVAVVEPAVSNAGGGASFLDLAQLGGQGSVLIEGLSFGNVDATDFIL